MKKAIALALALILVTVLAYSCRKSKSLEDNSSVSGNVKLDLPETIAEYYPENSPNAHEANLKATIGRVLFYDTRLSLNNAISCASCHKQSLAFADNERFSRGFENKLTGRNSPTIQNLFGINRSVIEIENMTVPLFWDGRESKITELVGRPISNHIEMGIENTETLGEKLSGLEYYRELFGSVYADGKITFDRIAECMSFFMAAIKSDNTRFDRHSKGEEGLSALELYGWDLFISKYNCVSCHNPAPYYGSFSNFANIGLDAQPADKGRGAISRIPNDNGRFKVPVLRNVALTAPYMHDGRFETLEEVIDHYSEGVQDDPNLDEALKDQYGKPMKMHISDVEKKALIAFLHTMTDYDMITDPKFSNPFIAN